MSQSHRSEAGALLADLPRCRTLMGAAAADLLALPDSTVVVTDRFWMAASGLAEPSLNQVLLHTEDPALLQELIVQLEARPHPVLLSLAGDAQRLSEQMPANWLSAGELPIMAIDLNRAPTAPDARVRPGDIRDAAAIVELFSGAFGTDRDVFTTFLADCFERSQRARWWLLEQDGTPVSTVLAVSFEDSVSLWCMATPPAHARRGYARALLGAVLHEAASAGAELGLLGATPAGLPLYQATGWTDIEHWAMYLKDGAGAA